MSFDDTGFNTKRSFTSPRIVLNTMMEQVSRSREDNCNDELEAISVLQTIPAIFCPFLVPAKMSTVGFYSISLILSCLQAEVCIHKFEMHIPSME
jgi:hypothetical protein